jgi:hypothetical protein
MLCGWATCSGTYILCVLLSLVQSVCLCVGAVTGGCFPWTDAWPTRCVNQRGAWKIGNSPLCISAAACLNFRGLSTEFLQANISPAQQSLPGASAWVMSVQRPALSSGHSQAFSCACIDVACRSQRSVLTHYRPGRLQSYTPLQHSTAHLPGSSCLQWLLSTEFLQANISPAQQSQPGASAWVMSAQLPGALLQLFLIRTQQSILHVSRESGLH